MKTSKYLDSLIMSILKQAEAGILNPNLGKVTEIYSIK